MSSNFLRKFQKIFQSSREFCRFFILNSNKLIHSEKFDQFFPQNSKNQCFRELLLIKISKFLRPTYPKFEFLLHLYQEIFQKPEAL